MTVHPSPPPVPPPQPFSILLQPCQVCCLQAVEQIKALQQGAVVASVASVLLTAALLGKGSDAVSVPVISSLLLAAGCSVAGLKLQELQKHFGFLDWQHSEH